MQLSNEDRDILARIAHAEAGVDGPRAGHAVIDVVLNRMASPDYPTSARKVVAEKHWNRRTKSWVHQFEPVKRFGSVDKLPTPDTKWRGAMSSYADGVVSGTTRRVAPDAFFFQNRRTTAKRGTTFKQNSGVRIGSQVFSADYQGTVPRRGKIKPAIPAIATLPNIKAKPPKLPDFPDNALAFAPVNHTGNGLNSLEEAKAFAERMRSRNQSSKQATTQAPDLPSFMENLLMTSQDAPELPQLDAAPVLPPLPHATANLPGVGYAPQTADPKPEIFPSVQHLAKKQIYDRNPKHNMPLMGLPDVEQPNRLDMAGGADIPSGVIPSEQQLQQEYVRAQMADMPGAISMASAPLMSQVNTIGEQIRRGPPMEGSRSVQQDDERPNTNPFIDYTPEQFRTESALTALDGHGFSVIDGWKNSDNDRFENILELQRGQPEAPSFPDVLSPMMGSPERASMREGAREPAFTPQSNAPAQLAKSQDRVPQGLSMYDIPSRVAPVLPDNSQIASSDWINPDSLAPQTSNNDVALPSINELPQSPLAQLPTMAPQLPAMPPKQGMFDGLIARSKQRAPAFMGSIIGGALGGPIGSLAGTALGYAAPRLFAAMSDGSPTPQIQNMRDAYANTPPDQNPNAYRGSHGGGWNQSPDSFTRMEAERNRLDNQYGRSRSNRINFG